MLLYEIYAHDHMHIQLYYHGAAQVLIGRSHNASTHQGPYKVSILIISTPDIGVDALLYPPPHMPRTPEKEQTKNARYSRGKDGSRQGTRPLR